MYFFHFLAASSLIAGSQAGCADFSSMLVEEGSGKSWKTAIGGATKPLENILHDNGVGLSRQRLWTTGGNYGLDYNLKLAARARKAGMNIYLDMFLSDTWTDPGKQATPSGWPSNIDDLADKVYNYALSTGNSFASAGIPLSIVSCGNEITQGLLWPLGKAENWYNIARLLHSCFAGIKDSKSSPRRMVHLDKGQYLGTQKYFYDNVFKAGPLVPGDFEIMGISYYPFYDQYATLANLKNSISGMKSAYGKSVMVVETNWPTACPNPKFAFPNDLKLIPFSPDGQRSFMTDVSAIAGGGNLCYWEPAWIDNPSLGSSCTYNLMVSDKGEALSSLSILGST